MERKSKIPILPILPNKLKIQNPKIRRINVSLFWILALLDSIIVLSNRVKIWSLF